jgi:death-on-curing protein
VTTSSVEPGWLTVEFALAVHEAQLADHGGGSGTRDLGLLESAIARPQHSWSYGETDLVALAASYAFGVSRNHPFVDGNKRTGWVLARTFLLLNGKDFSGSDEDAISNMMALASGSLNETQFADWLRGHLA